jgi:hypothetical protein
LSHSSVRIKASGSFSRIRRPIAQDLAGRRFNVAARVREIQQRAERSGRASARPVEGGSLATAFSSRRRAPGLWWSRCP